MLGEEILEEEILGEEILGVDNMARLIGSRRKKTQVIGLDLRTLASMTPI